MKIDGDPLRRDLLEIGLKLRKHPDRFSQQEYAEALEWVALEIMKREERGSGADDADLEEIL